MNRSLLYRQLNIHAHAHMHTHSILTVGTMESHGTESRVERHLLCPPLLLSTATFF